MRGAESRSAGLTSPTGTDARTEGRTAASVKAGRESSPVLADGVPSCGYTFDGLVCDEVGEHFCHPRAAYRLRLDAELAACADQGAANRLWGAHLWADPEVRWSTTWAAYLPVQTDVGEVKVPKVKQRPRSKPKPPPASRTVEVDDDEAVTITITIERRKRKA